MKVLIPLELFQLLLLAPVLFFLSPGLTSSSWDPTVLLMQQRLANIAECEREFTSPSVNGLEKDFYLTYFNNLS